MSLISDLPMMPGKDEKITSTDIYFNRRAFMKAGAVAMAVGATAWAYRGINSLPLRMG